MKYSISLFLLALAFVACDSGPKTAEQTLQTELDSLINVQKANGVRIKAIETELAAMDTTRKLTEVTAQQVTKGAFMHYFTVQGNLEADKNALLFPESQGLVKEIYVKEGQKVSQGQRIFRLDAGLVGNQIAELQTNLALATDVYERQERLWNQNIGSELQYLEAKNRKESLENSIATLRQQAGKSILKAPFSGTIDEIMPKVGEMGSPAMPVARIVNVKDVYLKTEVSERYLGRVNIGDSVAIDFNGVKNTYGVVQRTGNYINPDSRSFDVVVNVDNKDGMLKPNMLAKLTINDYKAKDAITLSSSLIQQDTKGDSFVYVLQEEGGKKVAKKKMIQPGENYNGKTEVLEGLAAGDLVIDKGARKITDGEEIQIVGNTATASK